MEKTYSTVVEGMTCGNCALTISKLLERKGMKNISANAASGEVSFTVVGDEDVDKVFDAIDDLGYHVVRESEQAAGHSHAAVSYRKETYLLLICALFTLPLLWHMFSSWHVLHMPWVQFALATPVYIMGMYSFLPSAVRSLKHGLPNMNVLIVLGASAAYIYSLIGITFIQGQAHQYLFFETAASIITLVMTGNWLEHRTVKATTAAIQDLVKLQPQHASLIITDSLGKETVLSIESKYVKTGDVVRVNTGDQVPVDGEIISGSGHVDEHLITGESVPVMKKTGDAVVGGTILQDGNLKVKATTVGNASVLSGIIRMVREAQGSKPPMQKLADKISAVFIPIVLCIALLTFLVNYFWIDISFPMAMMRSIAVMVVACPCAMGLATPAAVAVGLGRSARNGILVKGGGTLESLKNIKQIVFDKTGTLTTGKLKIQDYTFQEMDEAEFKEIVTAIEAHSSHPIARSINQEWPDNGRIIWKSLQEVKGKGLEATDEQGNLWQLGSERWLHAHASVDLGYDVYLYKNKQYKGAVKIADTLREDAAETVSTLQDMGLRVILLSGDKAEKCQQIAEATGIKEVYAEQSPEQKNEQLTKLMNVAPTAMVGDGINDAPALARATVGISLSEATQVAIQTAGVILSGNKLSTLPKALRLGKFTDQTIRQNLFWAFFYNILAIPVAAAGYLTPTWGAAIMAMSDVVLLLNSLRLGIRRLH